MKPEDEIIDFSSGFCVLSLLELTDIEGTSTRPDDIRPLIPTYLRLMLISPSFPTSSYIIKMYVVGYCFEVAFGP